MSLFYFGEVFCLFVWILASQSRIFHSHADVTIAVKGRKFFDLWSTLMAFEQWGFFNVTHLLQHGPTVYNGHLRGSHTCCRVFGSGAVTTSLYDVGLSRLGIEPDLLHARRTLYLYATTVVRREVVKQIGAEFSTW